MGIQLVCRYIHCGNVVEVCCGEVMSLLEAEKWIYAAFQRPCIVDDPHAKSCPASFCPFKYQKPVRLYKIINGD